MSFKSCKYCEPPKRRPGCHAHCPEYLEESAEYRNKKSIADKERDIQQGIIQQRNEAAYRAYRRSSRYKK